MAEITFLEVFAGNKAVYACIIIKIQVYLEKKQSVTIVYRFVIITGIAEQTSPPVVLFLPRIFAMAIRVCHPLIGVLFNVFLFETCIFIVWQRLLCLKNQTLLILENNTLYLSIVIKRV